MIAIASINNNAIRECLFLLTFLTLLISIEGTI